MSSDIQPNKALATSRRIASELLLLMAVVFVSTRLLASRGGFYGLEWIEAFAEAAMVGALADWFAVTALFRKPLNLPFPHTAVIPANKERIGEALGEFVQENFLSAEVIGAKLRELDLAERASQWLQNEEKISRLSERMVGIFPDVLRTIADSDLRNFLRLNLNALRKELRIASMLAAALTALTHGDKHQHLLDEALTLFEKLLERHEVFIRETLRGEMPWYVPNFVHDKVYRDVIKRVHHSLGEINVDPKHPARQKFSKALANAIDELRTSEDLEKRCQEIAGWIFESPLLENYLGSVWEDCRSMLISAVQKDQSGARAALTAALRGTGRALSADARFKPKFNSFSIALAQRFAHEYRNEIVALVRDTVRHWDSETIVAKIEEHVGRDLQYIRINGTLVGGAVGLILHALIVLIG